MYIENIEVAVMEIPLIAPFKTALRTVVSLESIVVRILTKEGFVGYGETAPTEAITGDTTSSILRAIAIISKSLTGVDAVDIVEAGRRIQSAISGNFNAKSAVEIAVYDLAAQAAAKPLYRYLGGEKRCFKTGITISLNDTEVMVQDACRAMDAGFTSIKIKLGDDYREDITRVERISRIVDGRMSLKLDANQGWTVEESVAFLSYLEAKEIAVTLIEQPVKREETEGLKSIKALTRIPLLADESAFSPEDTRRLLEMEAVDMINIKLDKCGGISKALEIADICNTYGVTCMIGCMMEGAISVGAAAHVASARSDTIVHFDLDAPILCRERPVRGGVHFSGPEILLSDAHGLGIESIKWVQWRDAYS